MLDKIGPWILVVAMIAFAVMTVLGVGAFVGERLTKDRHYQDGYRAHEIEVCMSFGNTKEECE